MLPIDNSDPRLFSFLGIETDGMRS